MPFLNDSSAAGRCTLRPLRRRARGRGGPGNRDGADCLYVEGERGFFPTEGEWQGRRHADRRVFVGAADPRPGEDRAEQLPVPGVGLRTTDSAQVGRQPRPWPRHILAVRRQRQHATPAAAPLRREVLRRLDAERAERCRSLRVCPGRRRPVRAAVRRRHVHGDRTDDRCRQDSEAQPGSADAADAGRRRGRHHQPDRPTEQSKAWYADVRRRALRARPVGHRRR